MSESPAARASANRIKREWTCSSKAAIHLDYPCHFLPASSALTRFASPSTAAAEPRRANSPTECSSHRRAVCEQTVARESRVQAGPPRRVNWTHRSRPLMLVSHNEIPALRRQGRLGWMTTLKFIWLTSQARRSIEMPIRSLPTQGTECGWRVFPSCEHPPCSLLP